ncbi:MAG: hypothetical protein R3Y09_06585 [Clostridia bacterium]
MANCTGNCNFCGCLIKATAIATEKGTTTVTVANGSLTDLCRCSKVCIGIYTSIPAESECNQIVVTDGTTKLTVVQNNQYWRPCKLQCRSVLVATYLDDPQLLVIKAVKGRGCL